MILTDDEEIKQAAIGWFASLPKSAIRKFAADFNVPIQSSGNGRSEESYTPLHSGKSNAILSAGTRSSIVEELEKVICSRFPEKRFILNKAVPRKGGWYYVSYLFTDKSDTNNFNVGFGELIFLAHQNSNGGWDILKERK